MKIENYKQKMADLIFELIQCKFDILPENLSLVEFTFTTDGVIVTFEQYDTKTGYWDEIKHLILPTELQIFLYLYQNDK